MPVAAEPKPFTHALPGGRAGATVRVRPLLSGEILAPDPGLLRPPAGPARRWRWRACSPPAARAGRTRRSRRSSSTIPRRDRCSSTPACTPPWPTDPRDNLGALGARMYTIRMRPAAGDSRAAGGAGDRPARAAHGRHDAPALRPRQRRVAVPAGDVRRQPRRVGGGLLAAARSRATARASSTTPSTGAPSTTRAAARSARSRRSAAAWTCSPTGRCGSSPRRATRPATSR